MNGFLIGVHAETSEKKKKTRPANVNMKGCRVEFILVIQLFYDEDKA